MPTTSFKALPAIVLAGFIASGLAVPCAFAQQIQDGPVENVKVVNVSRGDVLRVADGGPERVVMLYGVTSPDPNTPIGAQAKKFTQDRIGDRTVPMTVRYRQPGVDYVEIELDDGKLLNHQLLLAGLGKLDTLSASGDDAYAALEDTAKAEETGLWRPSEDLVADESVETRVIAIEDSSELPVERFKRVKELERDVEFAVALEHWKGLTDAQKTAIQNAIQERARVRTTRAEATLQDTAAELDVVSGEVAKLEAQVEAKEEELSELGPAEEEQAVLDLYAQDPELVRLEQRLADAQAATEIAVRDYGGTSTTYYRAIDDEDIAEQLVVERRQLLAAEEQDLRAQFEARRDLLQQELLTLQQGMDELLNDYNAVETDYTRASAGVDTRTATADASLSMLQQLEQAVAQGFEPDLKQQRIGIWKGQGPSETPAFDVNYDVWVLDYDAGAATGERQLQITVLRESDNAVVRQIVDNDLRHRSFTTLTERGGVYLRISAPDDLAWTVTATGYARD